MRLVIIRHAEPDYAHDSLTEKGEREAKLLAQRVKNWTVDDVYLSPLGRAQRTAQPCLEEWGRRGTTLEWAQEFSYPVDDGKGGKRIVWDYFPSEWTADRANFCENEWVNVPRNHPVRQKYEWVCASLDALLEGYGYVRSGRAYRVQKHSDKTIVIFCHFGVGMILLSHLLNIPAQTLLHGVFLAPSSVTVLNTEERNKDEAYFRAERIGDTHHLIAGGEPISRSGYFAPLMQE